MIRYEYRVSWKREGLGRVRKFFQTEIGALDKAARLNDLEDNPPPADGPWDAFADLPKLAERPVVERRAVGDWEPVS